MENKSHLSRDKWLLFWNTRLLLSGRRDCGRCTRLRAEGTYGGWGCATDPARGILPYNPWTCARQHARRYEGNKSGPAPCGHRKQPVICKNFPCFILLLYRYKGTKKSRKNRIFSMKNVTISDIIFTLVLRSNPTTWKCLENARKFSNFVLPKGNNGSAQAGVEWRQERINIFLHNFSIKRRPSSLLEWLSVRKVKTKF